MTISLCMIVKNEEDVLGRCLESVQDLVDEIIIVDTGSTDTTLQIAAKYTDKIYSFHWNDDFSEARNFSFSKASMDYCMWLDADDIMQEKDRARFNDFKHTSDHDTDMVMMRYNVSFDEYGNVAFWYYRERLIKRSRGYLWQGAVHEVITPEGKVTYSDVAVTHKKLHAGDPDRNLNIYSKLLVQGKVLNVREQYYYARELYYHSMYEKAAKVFEKFMENSDAWIENKIEACIMMSNCYRQAGEKEKSLRILLKSLEYSVPRAEVCCEIGGHFMEEIRYDIAIFWYETAKSCQRDFMRGGFVLSDCYGYIPALQLCVCYDRLGQYETAEKYNEEAGAIKPDSVAFQSNKVYFEGKHRCSSLVHGKNDKGVIPRFLSRIFMSKAHKNALRDSEL